MNIQIASSKDPEIMASTTFEKWHSILDSNSATMLSSGLVRLEFRGQNMIIYKLVPLCLKYILAIRGRSRLSSVVVNNSRITISIVPLITGIHSIDLTDSRDIEVVGIKMKPLPLISSIKNGNSFKNQVKMMWFHQPINT